MGMGEVVGYGRTHPKIVGVSKFSPQTFVTCSLPETRKWYTDLTDLSGFSQINP